ncbi:ABC transporter permease [Halonatronum saccharophilum]|uniref:ABC transporter permease n=1 Tax=Halonatronum saccharophilum TaxID=150060 RepID=UPI00048027B4|nr:ABC transporter permease [Halonatronum saccharophilum]
MEYILTGVRDAIGLILTLDQEVIGIALLSINLSLVAILLASLIGIPLGFLVGYYKFKGRRFIITLLNTLLSLPPVVIGILVFSFISKQGPLGEFGLLFTPQGIIIGQTILALPIITALTVNTVKESEHQIVITALSLGASSGQALLTLLKEVKFGILGAVITGYGRVIGEVGVSMMIGGNIRNFTRTLTTAIALETGKGEFSFGIALGIILMLISFIINLILHSFQEGGSW